MKQIELPHEFNVNIQGLSKVQILILLLKINKQRKLVKNVFCITNATMKELVENVDIEPGLFAIRIWGNEWLFETNAPENDFEVSDFIKIQNKLR